MPDATLTTAAQLRAGLAETWANLEALVDGLDEAGWAAPTGCPGWTVQDCVAHIADVERMLLGESQPEHRLPDLPHVTDDFKRGVEVGVDRRRAWAPQRVLADFRAATAARLEVLAAMDDRVLDERRPSLLGVMSGRSALGIRVFDCWSHEQDVRRALRRPGGLDGPAAAHSRERLLRGAAHAVQRRLHPPAGTTVLVEVTGPSGCRRALVFDGEAGRVVEEEPASPQVTLRLDLQALTVLGCGRHDDPGAAGRVEVEGDTALGRRMLEQMAFTP